MVTEGTKSIGNRIRTARQEKGLSVEVLAEKAGCSDEYLEWVENGQVEPPVALLLQLAKSMQLAQALEALEGLAGQLGLEGGLAAWEGLAQRMGQRPSASFR